MNNPAFLINYYYPHLTSEEITKVLSDSRSQAKSLYWRSILNIFKGNLLEELDREMQKSFPKNLDDVLMEVTGDYCLTTERLSNKATSLKRKCLLYSLKDLRSYYTQLNAFLAVYYKKS